MESALLWCKIVYLLSFGISVPYGPILMLVLLKENTSPELGARMLPVLLSRQPLLYGEISPSLDNSTRSSCCTPPQTNSHGSLAYATRSNEMMSSYLIYHHLL